MKMNLQLFAEAVAGKKIIYLYRILSEAASNAATALAFTTENERDKTKDADSTITKDGSIRTPSESETEITAFPLPTACITPFSAYATEGSLEPKVKGA